nr:hypothetical protein EP46_04550 [Pantoea sp. 3.5.1]
MVTFPVDSIHGYTAVVNLIPFVRKIETVAREMEIAKLHKTSFFNYMTIVFFQPFDSHILKNHFYLLQLITFGLSAAMRGQLITHSPLLFT